MDNITEVCERNLPVADAIDEVAVHGEHPFVTGGVSLIYTVNFPAAHNISVVILVNFDFFRNFHVATDADTVQFGTEHTPSRCATPEEDPRDVVIKTDEGSIEVTLFCSECISMRRDLHRLPTRHVSEQVDDMADIVPEGRRKFLIPPEHLLVEGRNG